MWKTYRVSVASYDVKGGKERAQGATTRRICRGLPVVARLARPSDGTAI
jgi:hypothetical protein